MKLYDMSRPRDIGKWGIMRMVYLRDFRQDIFTEVLAHLAHIPAAFIGGAAVHAVLSVAVRDHKDVCRSVCVFVRKIE